MSEAGKFLNAHQWHFLVIDDLDDATNGCVTCDGDGVHGHAQTCELAAILTAEGFSPRFYLGPIQGPPEPPPEEDANVLRFEGTYKYYPFSIDDLPAILEAERLADVTRQDVP